MFKSLLPKEYVFYDFFEEHSAAIIETCKELMAFMTGEKKIEDSLKRIKELERKADEVTHKCTNALIQTFITPIERTDIHLLIKRLDDIIDSVYSAVTRISLYEIHEIRPEAVELSKILLKASEEIDIAVKTLRNMKQADFIKEKCDIINKMESEGDQVHHCAIVNLFKEDNAVLIIKWKEILDRLERAIDRCEDVSNIMVRIVIASS